MRNRSRSAVLLLAPACLLTAGCVEATLTYTLNPDGSGKVKIDAVVPPWGGTAGPLDELVKDTLRHILQNSEGVTAWKEVSAELRDDGKVRFVGTGYFDDFNDVRFEMFPALAPKLLKSDDGALTLVFERDDLDELDKAASERKRALREIPDAELDEYILRQRAAYQQSRAMLLAMLTGMDLKSVFKLPGPVREARVFDRVDESSVSTQHKGRQILDSIDEFMAHDNAWFRRRMREKAHVTFPEPH